MITQIDHYLGQTISTTWDLVGQLLHQRILQRVVDYEKAHAANLNSITDVLALQTANPEQAKLSVNAHTAASTELHYDIQGHLSHTEQRQSQLSTGTQANPALNRAFVNDAQGHAILISQGAGAQRSVNNAPGANAVAYAELQLANPIAGYAGGVLGAAGDPNAQIQRQLIVAGGANDGEVLARYGNRAQGSGAYDWFNQHYVDAPLLVGAQDNVQGLRSAPAGSLANAGASLRGGTSGMSVTVLAGQTLADIARMTLGDSRQWYRIAQANALASDADLKPGMVLQIPGGSTAAVGNTSNTFRPYDPTRATGELSPTLPMPAAAEGCGAVGQVIALVVTIVVTAITRSPALGNLAGQAVLVMSGDQQGINWKSVAVSYVAGEVGSGMDRAGMAVSTSSPAFNSVANAMIANAATQGVSVALGLQDRFDWRGVAASGFAAGVGYEVGQQLATTDMSPLAQKMVRGAVAGTVGTVVRGGKLSLAQLATDAFGQVNAADFARQSLALGGANSAYGAEEMAGDAVREGNRFAWAAQRNRQEAQAELTLAMNDTLVDLFSNPMYPYRVNSGYGVQVAAGEGYAGIGTGGGGGDGDGRGDGGADDDVLNALNARGTITIRDRSGVVAGRASKAGWVTAQDQATSDLYASGAGDVRDTSPAQGLMVNPQTGMADFKYTSGQVNARLAEVAGMIPAAFDAGVSMPYGEQMRNVGSFFGDVGAGAAKGLVNVIPETAAFGYRMTGYAAAGLVSLVDTDRSDRMFAQYERVTGHVLDYDNGVQEVSGLLSGLVGPTNALRGVAVAGDMARARLATSIRTEYELGWDNFVTRGVDVAGNPSVLSSPVAQALRGELLASGRPMSFAGPKTEEILKSSVQLPTMRNASTGEFFYKLQPLDAGGNPLNSVYWMNSGQYARVQGMNAAEIGNVMGLPAPSTAHGAFHGWQVFETTPRIGANPLVFESQIAPATQGGNYSVRGLDFQSIIANPKAWYPARPLGTIPGGR